MRETEEDSLYAYKKVGGWVFQIGYDDDDNVLNQIEPNMINYLFAISAGHSCEEPPKANDRLLFDDDATTSTRRVFYYVCRRVCAGGADNDDPQGFHARLLARRTH